MSNKFETLSLEEFVKRNAPKEPEGQMNSEATKPNLMTKYLTVPEVAENLRCSIETVRRMIRRGELIAVKVGLQWRIPANQNFEYIRC